LFLVAADAYSSVLLDTLIDNSVFHQHALTLHTVQSMRCRNSSAILLNSHPIINLTLTYTVWLQRAERITLFHFVHSISAADISIGCCQQQIQTLVYLWLTQNDVSECW